MKASLERTNSSIITQATMDSLALEKLDEHAKAEVLRLKSTINVEDTASVMAFGSEASNNIMSLSKDMLKSFKLKDIPGVEALIPTLNEAFSQVDTASLMPKKQTFLGKLFKTDKIGTFVQKYENVEQVVQGIQKQLQQAHHEILRDIEAEKLMGQQTVEFINALDYSIFALKLAYQEEVAKIEAEEAEVDTNDVLAMHMMEERKDQVTFLDRQAYNLTCQRVQAIQTLPILKTIITGNEGLAANISSAITQSIPTWERNIVIALQLYRQQGALKIERAVHDMTNELIKTNSSLLKENAVGIAKAVESGVIDIESLESTNKNLIETAKALAEVANAASKSRAEGYNKLDGIVKELVESETARLITPSAMLGSK